MATVKLFTIHAFKHGQDNVIPYAGKTHISKEGFIEVDASIAQKIVDLNIGYQHEDPKSTTTTTVEVTTTTTEPATTTTTTVAETTTTTTVEATTTTSTVAEVTTTTTAAETVETTTLSPEDKIAFTALLDSPETTLVHLQELAGAFPRAEWISLDQPALIAYLKQKIS